MVNRSSRRHAPLPPNWYRTRKRILRRDGYRCTHIRYDTGTRCTELATDVDHKDPLGGEADSNLTSLCGYHHREKSSSEGGRAVHKGKAKPKKHPGMYAVAHMFTRSYARARMYLRDPLARRWSTRIARVHEYVITTFGRVQTIV